MAPKPPCKGKIVGEKTIIGIVFRTLNSVSTSCCPTSSGLVIGTRSKTTPHAGGIANALAASPGMADPDVLAWAAREERILLTFDKDFGELVCP